MFKQVFVALLVVFSISVRAQERPAAYALDEEFNICYIGWTGAELLTYPERSMKEK